MENEKFYVDQDGEINLKGDQEDITINIGGNQTVYIDKLFGPISFTMLRITPDLSQCKWKIEKMCSNESECEYWKTVCEIDAQDFD